MDRFVDDLSDRARQLVWSLDERFLNWANQLPYPFHELALSESTYTGGPGEKFFKLSSSVNPVNMHSAWLFWDLFDVLPDWQFIEIAEAGAFWSMSAILLDHLVDGQIQNPSIAILLQQKLLQQSRSCFRAIFPQTSSFWSSFARYEEMYVDALGEEASTQKQQRNLTYEAFLETARAKAATMLVTIAAFSEATGQPELITPIELSIELCAQAGQLYDDLQDWQFDLSNRHVTWVLLRILDQANPLTDSLSDHQDIQIKLEQNGLSLGILADVLARLAEAEKAVEGLNCPGWKNYLEVYQQIVRRDQKDGAVKFVRHAFSPIIGEDTQ